MFTLTGMAMSTARQTRGGSKDQVIAGAPRKVANRRLNSRPGNSRSHPANNGQGNIVETVTSTEARTRANTEINDPAIIASQPGPAGVVAVADRLERVKTAMFVIGISLAIRHCKGATI
jgi:hypothetical protein